MAVSGATLVPVTALRLEMQMAPGSRKDGNAGACSRDVASAGRRGAARHRCGGTIAWGRPASDTAPDAHLPARLATGLVDALPRRTVLFVAGDNDTYPVWQSREVLGHRPDITLVTVPLIGAGWYANELIRRNPDLAPAKTSEGMDSRSIADAARDVGRPVAAAITLNRSDRIRLNGCWRVIGAALLDDTRGNNCLSDNSQAHIPAFPVDSALLTEWVNRNSRMPVGPVKPSIDPASEYFARALDCPRQLLAEWSKSRRGVSLDSMCKL